MLRVKRAATIVCARKRFISASSAVLKLQDIKRGDESKSADNRIQHLFGKGGGEERTFDNGWEVLMGQGEIENFYENKGGRMRYPGEWKLAGGSVDEDESVSDAAKRELREEFMLNTSPDEINLHLLNIFQTRPVMNTSYIMHNFVCFEEENK